MTDSVKKKIVGKIAPAQHIYLKALESYERIQICESCDKYIKLAKICSECKCFMPVKTRLRFASCPLGKWSEKILDGTDT